MFTFFHRKKKIVIDCFTTNHVAHEYAPIVRATKKFPDWWTNLPSKKSPNNSDFLSPESMPLINMKGCYGFLELYKKSLILSNWTETHFKVSEEHYQYRVMMGISPEEHSKVQYGAAFNNYHHAKLICPWSIREKSGIQFMFSAALWHLEDYDFKIIPGLLEFKAQHASHINIFIPKKKTEYGIYIPISKPLVYLTPLSEDKIEVKNHLVDEKEFNRIHYTQHSFLGHLETIRLKNDLQSKKCPFSWKK